ncbi:hypothetical protein, partial [Streptomyces hydrogenans]
GGEVSGAPPRLLPGVELARVAEGAVIGVGAQGGVGAWTTVWGPSVGDPHTMVRRAVVAALADLGPPPPERGRKDHDSRFIMAIKRQG